MRRPPLPPLFGHAVTALHCAGVGGMGVGPLAIYLARLGFRVSGEDDAMTEPMRVQLVAAGVEVRESADLPADCGLLACSSALRPDHPALVAAQSRGLPVVRRGALLAEVTRSCRLVAVCGSHGKTTTTAMLVAALRSVGFPAGYVLGGLFADDAIPPAAIGASDWVVAEIDESDGTIADFAPEISVAVNLDWDHPDQYPRLEELAGAFGALFARTRGTVLVSDACALSARVVASLQRTGPAVLTFGRTGDYRAEILSDSAGCLELELGGLFLQRSATVRTSGDFNASNATAALAAAQLMGAALPASALAGFPGVRRRQSILSASEQLTVIEDYAHHPAEIRALLSSLRRRAASRLLVVFQPHRFSRTARFKSEFAAALALGDAVFLLDVYGAGEASLVGGSTADLYAELVRAAPSLPVRYLPGDAAGVLAFLSRECRPGDWVAFVGAGDIDRLAHRWVERRIESGHSLARWDVLARDLAVAVSPATKICREESLAKKTTIRIGGAARLYAEPVHEEDLSALVSCAHRSGVPVVMLGRGSNLIVPDEGIDALVVSLRQPAWEVFELRPDGSVWAGAGLRLKNLCGLAVKAGLAGFEFMEGIPGNLGGALRMNAGAMGGWIFDVVEAVRVMRSDGAVVTLPKSALHVGYRHCAELSDVIALGALLHPVARSAAAEIGRQLDVYRDRRQESQPREASAGCIFKNPPGGAAGRLIDASGLKGERVGDAEVSAVHANFIVNRGHASAADVIALVRKIRARVEQAQGVRLEPEVLLFGKKWEDVL